MRTQRMKHWPAAIHSWIPAIAIVVGASLLVGGPFDQRQPAARLVVGSPQEPTSMQSYFATSRKTGVSPLITPRASSSSGRVIPFTIDQLTDLEGKRCELHWAQFDLTRLRPAAESAWQYDDVLAWPDGLFFPDAETTELKGEAWIPEPSIFDDAGRFFFRLRLLCDDEEVARDDTDSFQVRPAAPRPPSVRVPPTRRTSFDPVDVLP
jgi:hypothetical protein